MNPAQVVLGGLLALVIPGYFITKALFPRGFERGPDWVLTAFLTVILSISTSLLVGTILGFLPAPKSCATPPCGFFQGAATGFPFIELSLALVTLVAFVAALARGAFPRLGGWLARRLNSRFLAERAAVGEPAEPTARIAVEDAPLGASDEASVSVRWELVNLHARRYAARALGNAEVAKRLDDEIAALEATGRRD